MGGGAREAAGDGELTNPADIVIRIAAESDIGEIAGIETESFSDAWPAEGFEQFMKNPRVIFLVAAEPATERVAGYIVMLHLIDESEIMNIAVDPSRRRCAIGARLLDAGIAESEARGSRTTFLEVRESNEAARRLYEGRGFREVSRRHRYYLKPVEDALVLRRAMKG